ncbi:MAG: type II toxin-antitoxin system RelE/ParE family toxin [Thermoanaerobaculia bacterium]
MTTYDLVIRPEADVELAEAARWYEERRSGLGGEFLDSFLAVSDWLRQNPYLYALVVVEARRALLPGFPYSVLYEIHGDEVVVLACFHESRDPEEWRRRV